MQALWIVPRIAVGRRHFSRIRGPNASEFSPILVPILAD
jgi:hypothetical protein